MTTKELTTKAAYDTDWHVFVEDPEQGPLGYCTGVGHEAFDPEAANRVLEASGWRMTGPWVETPPDAEEPYTATIVRA